MFDGLLAGRKPRHSETVNGNGVTVVAVARNAVSEWIAHIDSIANV